jgi:hypothetical protein
MIKNFNKYILIFIVIILFTIILSYIRKSTKENFSSFRTEQIKYYKNREGENNNTEKFYELEETTTGDYKLELHDTDTNTKSLLDDEVERCNSYNRLRNKEDYLENTNCGICISSDKLMYGDEKGPKVDYCNKGWVKNKKDYVKYKEREICSKVNSCALMTGEASICGWSTKLGKAVVKNPNSIGYNIIPKYDEDKDAGRLYTAEMCAKNGSYGSCDYYGSSHDDKCLKEIWTKVGCSSNNSSTQINNDGTKKLWSSQPLDTVINDMKLYKKYADSDNYAIKKKYYKKCYGRDAPVTCDYNSNNDIKCYQDAFIQTGCLKAGSAYPSSSNYSYYKKYSVNQIKDQIKTKIKNSHNENLDHKTRNSYYKSCYGASLPLEDLPLKIQPGLNAYVYRNLNWLGRSGGLLTPQPIRIYDLNKWWGTGRVLNISHDNVVVQIDGYISYPKDATVVQYRIGSDDGSRLFINGKKIIDNWGLHGFRWRQSNELKDVTNVTDEFKIDMYERGGAAHLFVQWRINGGPWSSIPSKYLNSAVVSKNKQLDNYTYMGCFKDNGRRAMPYLITRKGTFDDIMREARRRRFKYVGLQYGNGFGYRYAEAWGSYDENYGKYGRSYCARLNTGQVTGISWSNAVYKLN